MMENDKLISMKMPVEMIEDLKKLSKYNGLTMSAQVRMIVIEYLRKWKTSNKES